MAFFQGFTSLRALLVPATVLLTWLSAASASLDPHVDPTLGGMSLREFQGILLSSVDNEIGILQEESGDPTQISKNSMGSTDVEDMWEHLVDHGWIIAESTLGTNGRDLKKYINADKAMSSNNVFPFLLCVLDISLKSGFERMALLQEKLDVSIASYTVVSNKEDKSCFVVMATPGTVLGVLNDNIHGIPLVDQMKITPLTIEDVTSPGWSIPPADTVSSRRLGAKRNNWQRTIMVTISPGVVNPNDNESTLHVAKNIVKDIHNLAEEGSRRRRQLVVDDQELSSGVGSLKGRNILAGTQGRILSLSEVFFATSQNALGKRETRRLSDLSRSFWSRSLQNGLESEHKCSNMFRSSEIRPLWTGFEIVLNPVDGIMGNEHITNEHGNESSASNQDCVVSLIAALSVHPHVITVEATTEVTLDNQKEQWVTQSNENGHRPWFDHGLTGRNQIVSVSDTGLDEDNCYFTNGPSQGNIKNGQWDFNTRKIAKYDNTFKDDYDAPQGHGTHVAGTVAGRKSFDGVNEQTGIADGIARDAKIHFMDLKTGTGGMSDPGSKLWFESFYHNGKGAKVANASWGRSGNRPYSTHCVNYDGALFDHDDTLLVTSAGNKGNDGPGSMKNPGECKNTLSVGITKSSGISGEPGTMISWSSQGPTAWGSTQPDLVAPGYSVTSANADPDRENECDGTGGTRVTSGTSMSAPVVAGTAALIRQYFSEGFYPCGERGCSKGFEPQGSLVKAVLMNGAQAVTGGTPYDNIQNMGQINLLSSLPLKGENEFSTIVVNGKAIADQVTDSIPIRIDKSKCDDSLLSITMVYTDPPAKSGCTECLVNHLDMTVVDENGRKYFPNGLAEADSTNTAERIRVEHVHHHQTFTVSVTATNLSQESQKYSLVISGCITREQEQGMEEGGEDTIQANPKAMHTTAPTASPSSSPTAAPVVAPTPSNAANSNVLQPWDKCSGGGWTPPANSVCTPGYYCHFVNDWWSGCQPCSGWTGTGACPEGEILNGGGRRRADVIGSGSNGGLRGLR